MSLINACRRVVPRSLNLQVDYKLFIGVGEQLLVGIRFNWGGQKKMGRAKKNRNKRE
jgi:hypothetical protein